MYYPDKTDKELQLLPALIKNIYKVLLIKM